MDEISLGTQKQSVTFLVSKPKCQSQECDIFGFETGFETKMSFSDGDNIKDDDGDDNVCTRL